MSQRCGPCPTKITGDLGHAANAVIVVVENQATGIAHAAETPGGVVIPACREKISPHVVELRNQFAVGVIGVLRFACCIRKARQVPLAICRQAAVMTGLMPSVRRGARPLVGNFHAVFNMADTQRQQQRSSGESRGKPEVGGEA